MIDPKKVQMMTKLAIYEQGQGKTDRAVFQCTKGVYLGIRRLFSFFAISIAYLLIAGLYCFRYINDIFSEGFGYNYQPLIIKLILSYAVVLVIGLVIMETYYRKRYEDAVENLKEYDIDLYQLDKYMDDESD